MWVTVAARSPSTSSSTPVAVTVRGRLQLRGVKRSGCWLACTRTLDGSALATLTATFAAGAAASATVQVAVPASSSTRTAERESTRAASVSVTVTPTGATVTAP